MLKDGLALAALALGLSTAAMSCALGGFEKVPAGKGGAGGTVPACNHAKAPARPTSADPGGTLDLIFALHTVDFAEGAMLADRPGLDLDEQCTCEDPAATSCVLPSFAATMSPPCDSADGRDNATSDLINYFKANVGTGTPQFNAAIAAGQWTILVRVSDYDGSPNDSKVTVGFYMTPGLGAVPQWNGSDKWPIRPESLSGQDPVLLDKNAYVAGGTLVSVVAGELELSGSLKVKIGSGIAMAALVKNGASWKLDQGLLAGTWNTRDALAGVGNLLLGGMKVCDQQLAYTAVRTAICTRVDIASAPSLPCDSLSFGMTFTADPAAFGTTAPPEMIPPPCKPDQCG